MSETRNSQTYADNLTQLTGAKNIQIELFDAARKIGVRATFDGVPVTCAFHVPFKPDWNGEVCCRLLKWRAEK